MVLKTPSRRSRPRKRGKSDQQMAVFTSLWRLPNFRESKAFLQCNEQERHGFGRMLACCQPARCGPKKGAKHFVILFSTFGCMD